MSKKRIPDRRYPHEFKIEAVKLAETVGINEAARRLDMPSSSIGNWVRAQRAGTLVITADGVRPVTEMEAELSRLRKEDASLKLDNEILRKAAAYIWPPAKAQCAFCEERDGATAGIYRAS